MKNIGFMAVAGVVSVIVASFLPSPPGMQSWLVFIGTVAAIAGSALGIPAHKSPAGWKVLLVLIVLAAFVFAVVEFRSVLSGGAWKRGGEHAVGLDGNRVRTDRLPDRARWAKGN